MNGNIDTDIAEYRKRRLEGKLTDLLPLSRNDSENIVKLRNQDKNRLLLTQIQELSIEDQNKWYDAYAMRNDDIYWCIYDKKHQFIGTTRLYNIEKNICEHGSFMVDEEYAEGAPYALEALILTMDFAFDVLHIDHVCNECRTDNKIMNNLSKRLGFVFQKKTVLRGIEHNYYLLDYDNYEKHRSGFRQIIDYFAEEKREGGGN